MKKRELKTLIKKYLGAFFDENSFCLFGGDTAFKLEGPLFHGIYFNTSRFNDSLTLDVFIMPLFEKPNDDIGWIMGKRVGDLMRKGDYWWDIGQDQKLAFGDINAAISKYAFPWLMERDSPQKILAIYETKEVADIKAIGIVCILAYCALWEGQWPIAQNYLRHLNEWFEATDDRRSFVVEDHARDNQLLEMLQKNDTANIKKVLNRNVVKFKSLLQLDKKTENFVKTAKKG